MSVSSKALASKPSEFAAAGIVAAISSFFAAVLTMAVTHLIAITDPLGKATGLGAVLSTFNLVFIGIALYTGAVVTANTVTTVIAGRVKTLALLRLVGAQSKQLRAVIARDALIAGGIGALIGAVVGVIVTDLTVRASVPPESLALMGVGAADLPVFSPWVIATTLLVVAVTWWASYTGSRDVLRVSPVQAITGDVSLAEEKARKRTRRTASIVLISLGALLFVLMIFTPKQSGLGLIVAFFGGILSLTGLVIGATFVMPALIGFVTRLTGHHPVSVIARRNAVANPQRTARTTIGILIGITLVTMFGVAGETTRAQLHELSAGEDAQIVAAVDIVVSIIFSIFMALVSVSAIIAAVGLVSNMSLTVLQRRREFGLLRAIGFSGRQVQRMITLEAAALGAVSAVLGLLLGTLYGWMGSIAVFGATHSGFIGVAVPWWLVLLVIVFAIALVLAASLAPARRAVRVQPVEALAVL